MLMELGLSWAAERGLRPRSQGGRATRSNASRAKPALTNLASALANLASALTNLASALTNLASALTNLVDHMRLK